MVFFLKKIFFLLAISIVFLGGCTQQQLPNPQANSGSEIIAGGNVDSGTEISGIIVEANDTVKVEYKGSLEDGTVFDSSEAQGTPLEFVAGAGQMIKGFDEAVLGMRLNEEKTVTLAPEKAYGFPDERKIVDIPRENVNVDWEQLQPGTPISSSVAGNGIVLSKTDSSVKVDFNHQLAGKTLVFWIKVVEIKKAE